MLSLGDLSRALVAQARHGRIKQELAGLSEQMTTGLKSDPARDLRGDITGLSAMQSSLERLEAYHVSNTETGIMVDAVQRVLDDMQTLSGRLGTDFLKVNLSGSRAARAALSSAAAQGFSSIVAQLNTHLSGRSLFAGVATDSAALQPPETLLADIRTALTGAVSADEVRARLDDWFDTPGGGFETLAYSGATQDLAPFRLNDGETISMTARADNALFRDLLKATAMAQLATDSDLDLSAEVQIVLLDTAGKALIEAQTPLTELRADIGAAQGRISAAQTRNDQTRSDTRISRNDLVAADPYETATRLEQVQSQLEALYAVTARNGRISLVNYLS